MGLEEGITDGILDNDFFEKSTDPQGVNAASLLDHPGNCCKVGTPRINVPECKLEGSQSQLEAETHVQGHSDKR